MILIKFKHIMRCILYSMQSACLSDAVERERDRIEKCKISNIMKKLADNTAESRDEVLKTWLSFKSYHWLYQP